MQLPHLDHETKVFVHGQGIQSCNTGHLESTLFVAPQMYLSFHGLFIISPQPTLSVAPRSYYL